MMKDKDKIFIIIYINVSKLDAANITCYINEVSKNITFDDTVIRLVIPVWNEETRVVCINPVLLDEEKYKEVEKTVEEVKKNFEEALKELEK